MPWCEDQSYRPESFAWSLLGDRRFRKHCAVAWHRITSCGFSRVALGRCSVITGFHFGIFLPPATRNAGIGVTSTGKPCKLNNTSRASPESRPLPGPKECLRGARSEKTAMHPLHKALASSGYSRQPSRPFGDTRVTFPTGVGIHSDIVVFPYTPYWYCTNPSNNPFRGTLS